MVRHTDMERLSEKKRFLLTDPSKQAQHTMEATSGSSRGGRGRGKWEKMWARATRVVAVEKKEQGRVNRLQFAWWE